jgi:hypothetical protein
LSAVTGYPALDKKGDDNAYYRHRAL